MRRINPAAPAGGLGHEEKTMGPDGCYEYKKMIENMIDDDPVEDARSETVARAHDLAEAFCGASPAARQCIHMALQSAWMKGWARGSRSARESLMEVVRG